MKICHSYKEVADAMKVPAERSDSVYAARYKRSSRLIYTYYYGDWGYVLIRDSEHRRKIDRMKIKYEVPMVSDIVHFAQK